MKQVLNPITGILRSEELRRRDTCGDRQRRVRPNELSKAGTVAASKS